MTQLRLKLHAISSDISLSGLGLPGLEGRFVNAGTQSVVVVDHSTVGRAVLYFENLQAKGSLVLSVENKVPDSVAEELAEMSPALFGYLRDAGPTPALPASVDEIRYDVALSFAGEDRQYAEALAELLRESGLRVFYDHYEQATLWGKDLYVHLHDVYVRRAIYCVVFASQHYERKVWTSHERQAAQERALREKGNEYLLPIRIDDTLIPGLPATIGYVEISLGVERIAELLVAKMKARRPSLLGLSSSGQSTNSDPVPVTSDRLLKRQTKRPSDSSAPNRSPRPMTDDAESALTWLHLSDIHFGHGKAADHANQKRVFEAIIRDAEALAKKVGSVDFLLVTGDVAFSGESAEYAAAAEHLEALAGALGLSLNDVFAVPGNHDVHRRSISPTALRLHNGLQVPKPQRIKEVDELLGHRETATSLNSKLQNYNAFTTALGAQAQSEHAPWWRQSVKTQLGPVELVGLNTALGCRADDDETRAVLGERQRHEAFTRLAQHDPEDQSLVLALMHHPPSFMCDGDELEARLSQFPHVLLSGHVHEGRGRGRRDFGTDDMLYHFSARAAHSDPGEPAHHGYAWFRLHRGGLTSWPRAWNSRYQKIARSPDVDSDRDGAVHEGPEKLPPHLKRWLEAHLPGPRTSKPPAVRVDSEVVGGRTSIPPVLEAYQIDRLHQWDLLCRTMREARYGLFALPSSPQHGVGLFVERIRNELGSALGQTVKVCAVPHKATAQVAGHQSAAAWLRAVAQALDGAGTVDQVLSAEVQHARLVLVLGPVAGAELESSGVLELLREQLPTRLLALDEDVAVGVDVVVLLHESAVPSAGEETVPVAALMAALRNAKTRLPSAEVAKLPRLRHPVWDLDVEPHLDRLGASPEQRRDIKSLFDDLLAERLNYNRFAHLMEAILKHE